MKKVIGFCLIIVIVLSACSPNTANEYSRNVFALDTILEFKVFGGNKAKRALNQAIDRVKEIEERMSATRQESDVSNINQNAGKQPVKVHDDTFYVIRKALEYGKLTDGAFDITVRPIIELWGIMSDSPRIPDENEIAEKLKLVDYQKVQIDEEDNTVYLEKEEMSIDLGAIAKGYAADEVARILKEAGVKHALINMGGNVLVIGRKPDETPWRIGIQDPRSEETKQHHIGIMESEDVTIVSSGDYERYLEEVYEDTGIRYHHIFNPKTGKPAQSALISCSIITENSIDADALSTSFFIMGMDQGFELIKKIGDIEVMAVTSKKEIYSTEGLKNKFEQSSKDYRIQYISP